MVTDLSLLADERDLRHLTDLLFVLADETQWDEREALFVDGPVRLDVTSLAGGEPSETTRAGIVDGWRTGLHEGKDSHHMATNLRVEIDGDRAVVQAQGDSWNRLGTAGNSDLWETWGTYRLTARHETSGWKLDGRRYMARHNRGNEAVRAHTE